MSLDFRPTPYQLQIIEKASLLRGAIITGYAQVEFLLADFVLKCREMPTYAGVSPKFPYRLESRIKATRQIVSQAGPFRSYAAEVETLVDGLLEFEERRHFIAHGFLIVTTNKSGTEHHLRYLMYRPVGNQGAGQAGNIMTNLAELEQMNHAVAAYAQKFVTLWRRIYLEQGLEGGEVIS